jgi:hypothetical protein
VYSYAGFVTGRIDVSDQPSAVNGKRNKAWGTMHACPACGQCLCFGCHPAGPCVDEQASPLPAGWYASGVTGASGAAGMRLRAADEHALR